MPKSGYLCRESCKTALLQCQRRVLPLTALGCSRFTLGHLREAQPCEPQSPELGSCWLQMQDVYVVASPPPRTRWVSPQMGHLCPSCGDVLSCGAGCVDQTALVGLLQSGGDSHCSTVMVLSSCGLSTGRDSLDFSDKNSNSFKVGLS